MFFFMCKGRRQQKNICGKLKLVKPKWDSGVPNSS